MAENGRGADVHPQVDEGRNPAKNRYRRLSSNFMKRLVLSLILIAPMMSEASLFGTERSWDFIQSVGGVTLGKPDRSGKGWRLPILCDVSGLKSFTVKPTVLNSGLAWADTVAKVSNQELLITIETGLAGAGKSSACGEANLASIPSGRYRVMYRDPDGEKHFIGEIDVGL